ncbi:MAG: RNA chaperone Hfq [Nitrospirae bacterium]|nr:RNA chaperone Hfq [Nitrospirota bacterium]
MSRSQINLQDAFLNHVRKEKIQVSINLAGGGKIEGLVKGFDNFVILVKHEGQHLIYKHAINTIVPERPVELVAHVPAPEAAQDAKEAAAPAAPVPAQVAPVAPVAPAVSETHESPDPAETVAGPPDDGEPWVEG